MKLLELLVQELPKRGGWPEGVNCISSHADGMIFHDGKIQSYRFSTDCSDGWRPGAEHGYTNAVSKNQYEAAIKQTEWSGEGLPPVGTRCEYNSESNGWVVCEILLYRKTVVIMESDIEGEGITMTHTKNAEFRPIRTEAERKREDAVKQMIEFYSTSLGSSGDCIRQLYDAIADGKISGVTTIPTVSEIMRATESCSREDAQKIVDLLNGA